MTQKTCFVICPIGEEGSKTRRQSDCVFEYIIKPYIEGLGFLDPIRVDKADLPSHITTEIIRNLVNANLVVADLSALNPNVFYELGIRHAYRKPCILISDWEMKPPFDVAGTNVISYTYDDPRSHKETVARIRGQIESFEDNSQVSSPVTVALGVDKLSEEGDDLTRFVLTLAEQVQALQVEADQRRTTAAKSALFDALIGRREESPGIQMGAPNALSPYYTETEGSLATNLEARLKSEDKDR